MQRSQVFALVGALALGLAAHVYSQAPAPVAPTAPATTAPASSLNTKLVLQQLQAMKAQNAKTLEKQTALLLKLDDLKKEAEQIKFLAKRG